MKKVIALFLILVVVASLTACTEEEHVTSDIESSNSQMSSEGVERSQYNIDMTLEAETQKLTETVTIEFTNNSEDAWDKICLRDYAVPNIESYQQRTISPTEEGDGFKSFQLKEEEYPVFFSIEEKGKMLNFARDEKDKSVVWVDLSEPLQPKTNTTIQIAYQVNVPGDGGRFGCQTKSDGKYTYFLGHFYPILAEYQNGAWNTSPYSSEWECFYSKCADYNVTCAAPEDYILISSGTEEKLSTADGKTKWKMTASNMRDFVIMAGNNLEVLTDTVDGVVINSYYLKSQDVEMYGNADNKQQGEVSLQAGKDALTVFNECYGKYPYSELDIVEAGYSFGGMEYPSLVVISDLYAMVMGSQDKESISEYRERLRDTVAHEIAHQWFYAVVGNDQYRAAWLDESFSAYSELVYRKHIGMTEEQAKKSMEEFEDDITVKGEKWLNLDYAAYSEGDLSASDAVYKHGKVFLYKLNQAMGDEIFFQMMKEYYQTFSFKEATTQDFLSLIEEYSNGSAEIKDLIDIYFQ